MISPPEEPPEIARAISIWQPLRANGETVFVRPAPGPFGDHHADRIEIPARKPAGTRRVCFFGESAAAGYLYAPEVTPAKLLSVRLQSGLSAPVEVIDLARTNERLATLVETAERSLQLDPDLWIVFAGNNWTLLESPEWSPYARDAEARRAYGAALAAEGLWGPVQAAARRVLERAAASLAQIARIADTAGVPVIVIVPEVNLADWASRQPVPWLPGDGVVRWYAAYERATAALGRGDPGSAIRHARAMQDLDDGVCSTAYRIFAEAHRKGGHDQAAAAACRDEIAACHHATLAFLAAPQVSPMMQTLLRRAAGEHGFGLVDLPAVFARHTGSELTDGRLFLDYCHLSAEGMEVAMEAVARAVEDRLATATRFSDQLPARQGAGIAVAAVTEATARFGAAVHCAHRWVAVGPRGALLRRLCGEALAASQTVAEAMVAVVEARTAGLPAVLSNGQSRLASSGLPFGLQQGWRYPHLDSDLIEAVRASLVDAGRDASVRAVDRALERIAVETTGTVDLIAHGFFLDQPLEQLFPAVMPDGEPTGRTFFRAIWPTTTLAFVSMGEAPLRLELTARLPRQDGLPVARDPAEARISVEGIGLGPLPLAERWRRTELVVPADLLRVGINRLTLHWPMPADRGEDALRAAAERLERGIEADVHPVFGEIFSARCGPA